MSLTRKAMEIIDIIAPPTPESYGPWEQHRSLPLTPEQLEQLIREELEQKRRDAFWREAALWIFVAPVCAVIGLVALWLFFSALGSMSVHGLLVMIVIMLIFGGARRA